MSNSMNCFGALLARYANGIQPATTRDPLTEYLAARQEPGPQRRPCSPAPVDHTSEASPEGR